MAHVPAGSAISVRVCADAPVARVRCARLCPLRPFACVFGGVWELGWCSTLKAGVFENLELENLKA